MKNHFNSKGVLLFQDILSKIFTWKQCFFSIVLLCLSINGMSQITFVSSSTGTAATGTASITINAPAGIQVSDLLLANFSMMATVNDSVRTLSGWTKIRLNQDP